MGDIGRIGRRGLHTMAVKMVVLDIRWKQQCGFNKFHAGLNVADDNAPLLSHAVTSSRSVDRSA